MAFSGVFARLFKSVFLVLRLSGYVFAATKEGWPGVIAMCARSWKSLKEQHLSQERQARIRKEVEAELSRSVVPVVTKTKAELAKALGLSLTEDGDFAE